MGDRVTVPTGSRESVPEPKPNTPVTRASRKRALEEGSSRTKPEMGKTPKRDRSQSNTGQTGQGPTYDRPPTAPDPTASTSAPSSGDYATVDVILQMEKRLTAGFASRLGKIEEHVLNNASQIREIKASFDPRELLLEGRLNKHIQAKTKEVASRMQASAAPLAARAGLAAGGAKLTDKQVESYYFHRRSLRIWPIKGPEIAKSTKTFIQSKLKIVGLGKMEIKKERTVNPRFPDEVIIIFESKEAMNTVKAAGRNLN